MYANDVVEHPFWQQNKIIILLWIAVVIIPFLTYQLTLFLFHRTARSDAPLKTPPTIPYWVPGIFHGVGLTLSGPSAYFGKLIKEYGSHAPFVVKIGPLSFLVLRDANHVKKIFQSPEQMTATQLHVRVFDKVMGSPKAALPLYAGVGEGSEEVSHAHSAVPRLFLSGQSLIPVADVYVRTFRRQLSNKMIQTKSWMEIEDVWSFLQNEITRATVETVFGSALLKQYPKLVRDFWEFDGKIENFTFGLPRFMMPTAYTARDRLHENLQKWLKTADEGDKLARIGEDDPVWDESMGSKFFQAHDTVFAKIPTMDYQARAAEALAIMQGSNSNTMPSTFWYIIETLRNPSLTKHLTKDLSKHCVPASDSFDTAAMTAMPIIQSMHAEIGRLRVATGAIRTNEVPNFKLDDKWLIPKGMSVMIFSHDLALNTELWEKARPQTVERPLEDFWAERFLIPDKPTNPERRSTIKEEKIGTGRFSMEGVEALHTTFGGGQHLCPGQYLARAIQASTLAVLLCEYEIQLSDPDDVELILPRVRELAYGTVKPLDKIRVRIRKREGR